MRKAWEGLWLWLVGKGKTSNNSSKGPVVQIGDRDRQASTIPTMRLQAANRQTHTPPNCPSLSQCPACGTASPAANIRSV
jgi:hypothetical protein